MFEGKAKFASRFLYRHIRNFFSETLTHWLVALALALSIHDTSQGFRDFLIKFSHYIVFCKGRPARLEWHGGGIIFWAFVQCVAPEGFIPDLDATFQVIPERLGIQIQKCWNFFLKFLQIVDK